jgi:dienelactone hydrolase
MIHQPPRFHPEAAIPLAAGLTWLWCASSFGVVGFLFSVIPGCLLVAAGVGMLLWAGDLRIPQFAATGGLLGVPLALPAIFVAGPATAALLVALSAVSFVVAGRISLRQEPHHDDVPEPVPSLGLYAQVAADDALLSSMQVRLDVRTGEEWHRISREALDAAEMYEARGWLEKPVDYHRAPPPLETPDLRPKVMRRRAYEHMTFDSGYEPWDGEPGRERWLSFEANRTAHAWVLRHEGAPRPWLVCLHGYQMGMAGIDLLAFEPRHFHERLGLNLVIPVLPLHGARAVKRSGDRFLGGDPMDSVHAEAQAMWDLRRILSWVRAQEAPAVGALGYSLGGYQAALLSCFDEDLACVVAGIPLTDIARAVWRHAPMLHLLHAEREGIVRDHMAEVLRVVSPLVLKPRVPKERRFLFGGVADQLVTPDQVRDLWLHWERPRIEWYQGAHITFRSHPRVRRMVNEALSNLL